MPAISRDSDTILIIDLEDSTRLLDELLDRRADAALNLYCFKQPDSIRFG